MNELFREYDEIMIGKRRFFSDRFFSKDKARRAENAIKILQYSFTKYLRWPPEAIAARMNVNLMRQLHIQSMLKHINFPIEYDRDIDFYYLVSMTFKSHKLSKRDRTIHIYENMLSGNIRKYPKDYFSGNDGFIRAAMCLQYMINHYMFVSSVNELYFIFSTEEGVDYLKKYILYNICREIFDTPLDFLHFALPEEEKNDTFFHYYKFFYSKNISSGNNRKKEFARNYMLVV